VVNINIIVVNKKLKTWLVGQGKELIVCHPHTIISGIALNILQKKSN